MFTRPSCLMISRGDTNSLSSAEYYLQFLAFDTLTNGLYSATLVTLSETSPHVETQASTRHNAWPPHGIGAAHRAQ